MPSRLRNQGGSAASALAVKKDAIGSYIEFGSWKMYSLTAAADSLAKTSHATGQGSIFRSDGSKWQFLTNA